MLFMLQFISSLFDADLAKVDFNTLANNEFEKHFNKKINDKKVTRRFDDFMSSLSKVECGKKI